MPPKRPSAREDHNPKRVKFSAEDPPQRREEAEEEEESKEGSDIDDYDAELLDAEGLSKKKKKGLRDLDDESDEEGNPEKAKPKKKATNYLKARDIQGQEKTGEEYEEGQKLEPFNMNEEMEEGNFDENGFYTLKKTANESHDPWLDNLSNSDLQKAMEAKQKRVTFEASLDLKEAKEISKSDLLKEIIDILQPGEAPLKALRRLKPAGNKKFVPKDKMKQEQPSEETKKFDLLTENCYQMMSLGVNEIYSHTREELETMLETEYPTSKGKGKDKGQKGEGGDEKGERWEPPPGDTVQWEYKWTEEGETFGPYYSGQMLAWKDQGYFGNGVLAKKLGGSDFVSSNRLDFSLYIDDE